MSISEFYKNKTVLVTGGAGSIGTALVRTLLEFNPQNVVLIDNNEGAIFDLEQDLRSSRLSTFLADIRDKERMEPLFEGADFVFHLAALKNLPMCESNPYEAVKTNIVGTKNVIDACLRENVKKVIFTSTGKAVKPTTAYGASKLLAERLLTIANVQRRDHVTRFASVRFGNVMGSRGSVLPLFRRQIENGGPVTITHEDMVRPGILMSQALKLITSVGEDARGGEVFILKMRLFRIAEVAKVMIEELGPRYGHKHDAIKTEMIGIKAGEKLVEQLMTEREQQRTYETNEMFVITPDLKELASISEFYRDSAAEGEIKPYVSSDPVFANSADIKRVLNSLGYLSLAE
ncbi:MAG: SDR family NAD(P)-dependent oxidoreductase [Halobacteriota archaeon]